MDCIVTLEKMKSFGVGRRKLDDDLFKNDKPPPRLGVYDLDEENLCHNVIKTECNVPGCSFTSETLLEFEGHYNGCHRYTCGQCKRVLPTAHLLDLHIQETHDSFFAVMAERKPSYCCYIEDCKEKFMTACDRMEHCVKIHKIPKDFRFEQKQKRVRNPKATKKKDHRATMEVDSATLSSDNDKPTFAFNNSRQKGFAKYTGRKFTDNTGKKTTSSDVNMDDIATELRTNLPQ